MGYSGEYIIVGFMKSYIYIVQRKFLHAMLYNGISIL